MQQKEEFSIHITFKGKKYAYTATLAGRDRQQDVWHIQTRRKVIVLINKRPYNSSIYNTSRTNDWQSPELEDLQEFIRCLTTAIDERQKWRDGKL